MGFFRKLKTPGLDLLMIRTAEILLLSLMLALSTLTPIYAESMSEQELEDWFNDDSDMDIDEDNEGQLTFIARPADKAVLTTDAVVTMTDASLDTGMVSLQQCYRNLDPVPEVDVVYRYKNMQQLRIVSSENIAAARVVGNSVELKDVTTGAFVCIAANVQLLEKSAEDSYLLSMGPYYRRFLDGYYPYHAKVTINYPVDLLVFSVVSPSPRPHFDIVRGPGALILDAWFEGILQLDITFSSSVRD